MFSNIGRKIKTVAKVVAWIGIGCSILAGLAGLASPLTSPIPSIIVAVIGSLASWIGSFCLYGFGELIDKVSAIAEKLGVEDDDLF